MKGNFDNSLARVLVYEGGYSNNPKDPGGSTMKGITQATYTAWLAKNNKGRELVKEISDADVASIYRTEYWDRIKGDELPSGVDFCMFDAAVNSGCGGATTWAQNVVGVNPDGSLGNATLEAIQADDAEDFIRAFCSRRLGTLKRLRTWSTFGKGWSARIANVQKTALAWADSSDGPDPIVANSVGGNAKARMSDVPISKTSAIATHAATVGSAVATATAATTQSLGGISDTFAWIKYVLGGMTIASAVAGLVVLVSKSWNDAASNGVATAKVDPDADAEVTSVKILPLGTKIVAPGTAATVPAATAQVKPA